MRRIADFEIDLLSGMSGDLDSKRIYRHCDASGKELVYTYWLVTAPVYVVNEGNWRSGTELKPAMVEVYMDLWMRGILSVNKTFVPEVLVYRITHEGWLALRHAITERANKA